MQVYGVPSITRIMLVLSLLLGTVFAEAGTISRPNKTFGGTAFVNGVVPDASDFNGDVDTIYGEFNGSIDNANIKTNAAIAPSKINSDGFTVNVRTIGTSPCVDVDETDFDSKRWGFCSNAGFMQLVTKNSAGSVTSSWFQINSVNGEFILGGTGNNNVVHGGTSFDGVVTFAGGTNLTPTGMVSLYYGTSAPSGWLLLDGGSYTCTGSGGANATLCAQLVALYPGLNHKGSASATITVDTASDEIIHTAHGHSVGDRVHFSTTSILPSPLVDTTVYCIQSATTDRYRIGNACTGATVDFTSNGAGINSDHFNFTTPDARGRTPIGTGTGSGLTPRSLGATGGEETHVLTTGEMPAHNHPATTTFSVTAGDTTVGTTRVVGSNGPHAATFNATSSTSNTGGGGAHGVMDPFLVMTYIIKL